MRFISGTHEAHVRLEERLARFHGREAGMIFSSAYATVVSLLMPLITAETAVVSDELNHNCIINAIRLSRPLSKEVYKHLDLAGLEQKPAAAASAKRAVVITDGIFSMRGDHAPLPEIFALARRFDEQFAENVLVVVDDSHGVGALGRSGHGTEEQTGSGPAWTCWWPATPARWGQRATWSPRPHDPPLPARDGADLHLLEPDHGGRGGGGAGGGGYPRQPRGAAAARAPARHDGALPGGAGAPWL